MTKKKEKKTTDNINCFIYPNGIDKNKSYANINIPLVYTGGILTLMHMMKVSATQQKIFKVDNKEFLAKGFKNASLRKIVAEAGYIKGEDKAALFESLVFEATYGLSEQFSAVQDAHFDLIAENNTSESRDLSTK